MNLTSSSDPIRFRPLMLPAIIEKLGYVGVFDEASLADIRVDRVGRREPFQLGQAGFDRGELLANRRRAQGTRSKVRAFGNR